MVTIDIKATLVYLLFAALIVLVIYLIIIAKNLVKTIKETNKILRDASVISGIAADKAEQLQNLVGAVSNIVKAFGSLAAIFRKEDGEENSNNKKSK